MATEAVPTGKTERLELRVSPETKALLVRACRVAGTTLTGFAVTVLAREAINLLRDYHEVIELSERDTLKLLEALENPPEPTEKLREAWAEHPRHASDGSRRS